MPKSCKNQSKQALPRSELLKLEREAHSRGFLRVAGIDEAGRGPLAGPVVAAACLFTQEVELPGINDSKLLSPSKRKQFFNTITNDPTIIVGVGIVDHTIIDKINILQATHQAMHRAVDALEVKPDYLLVDGLQLEHEIPSLKVIRGDRLSQTIMAAAIVAKVTRDEIMLKYDEEYPQYGFAVHKGYGTLRHREALKKCGPSPIHRLSFSWG